MAVNEDFIIEIVRPGIGGSVELAPPGSLPNDGKVIADERGSS